MSADIFEFLAQLASSEVPAGIEDHLEHSWTRCKHAVTREDFLHSFVVEASHAIQERTTPVPIEEFTTLLRRALFRVARRISREAAKIRKRTLDDAARGIPIVKALEEHLDLQEALQRVLAESDSIDHSILCRVADGESLVDIGKALKISSSSLYERWARIRARLRKRLGPHSP